MNEIERKVAYIANPYFDYPIENIDGKDLPLEFINSNKLSLLLKGKEIEIETAKREEEKLKYMMNELHELKNDFDDSGVDFVLIKFQELPRPHRDIDILIIINNIENADAALKHRGYIPETDAEPYRRSYVKIVKGEQLSIDLHLEISWWGIIYLEKEDVWRHRVTRKINGVDIPLPSPEYEILITAVNTLFGEIRMNLFDVLHVASVITKNDVDMDFISDTAKKNKWLKQYLYFIRLCNEIYSFLYGKNLFKDFKSDSSVEIKYLPLRFPIYKIILLRLQRIFSDLTHYGVRYTMHDLRGYFLEILQIVIDYLREKMGFPTHPIFNMRMFLGGAAK